MAATAPGTPFLSSSRPAAIPATRSRPRPLHEHDADRPAVARDRAAPAREERFLLFAVVAVIDEHSEELDELAQVLRPLRLAATQPRPLEDPQREQHRVAR